MSKQMDKQAGKQLADKGKDALDQIILTTYTNLFSKVVKQKLERALEQGPPLPETVKDLLKATKVAEDEGEVDDVELDPPDENANGLCQVKGGTVLEVTRAVGPRTVAVSAELKRRGAKDVFKVIAAVAQKGSRIRALKIGKNFLNPQKVRQKSRLEKEAIKSVMVFSKRCLRLTSLDLRDVILTRDTLAAICELPAIRHLAFQANWREIEAVGCQAPDFNITPMANNMNVCLLDVRGYGNAQSPPINVLKMMVLPKLEVLMGLSCRIGGWEPANWLFKCHQLQYLDLEVENFQLVAPKMADSWNCLSNLTHAKFYSTTVATPPPLAKLPRMTTLILDMPLYGEVQDWAKDCLPKTLTTLLIMHVEEFKRAISSAFACLSELRLLYIVYYGDHPKDQSFIALPPSLDYFVMLEENNLHSENWDYMDQGRRLRGEMPALMFKLNAYAIPCREEVWQDVHTRINRFVRKPVVFDWNIECFRDDLKFRHDYDCKTFFYQKPKRVCDPPQPTLWDKCVEIPLGGGRRIGLVAKPKGRESTCG